MNRVRWVPIALVALLGHYSAALPSAAQERDQAANAKRGRVVGRVIAADTGRPITWADVLLSDASATPSGHTALTDDTGSFVLTVPEGRYRLRAYKPGLYLDAEYGATAPGASSTLLTVTAGGTTTVEIRMERAGVIAGRVFDQAGEPLPFADVVLTKPGGEPVPPTYPFSVRGFSFNVTQEGLTKTITKTIRTGASRLDEQSTRMTTNDRGEYRFFGLLPGDYVVSATITSAGGVRHAPAYYPGVLDPAAAAHIQIQPGQEVVSADFTLRLVTTSTVSGTAVGPEGQPLGGGALSLHRTGADDDAIPNQIASIKPDGSFSLRAPPGQYVLRARHVSVGESPRTNTAALSATQPLTIGENDLPGLVLRLTYGATLRGKIVLEGSTKVAESKFFSVTVRTGGLGAAVVATRDADGSFTLRGIEGGARRISAAAPPGWTLKGIYVDGQDVSDRLVDFRDDVLIDNASIVFTDVKTPVHVTVEYEGAEKSSVVVVYSADPALWTGRRTRMHTVTTERLTIDGLPPGDYLAVALFGVPLSEVKLLERLRPLAHRFQITEGIPVSIQLRAVALPR